MNALATHVGDGRWVVETPRPVAEVDKVVTVPSPSMMSVAGAGPMQPMAAVWPQDGAWVAPFPGAAPGAMTGQGVGAPFMQVPSEPWFEGAGELAEVPEADDHGGCGTNEAFEAAYLAAAAEASARGVIEPGERREALIDALMEEAAQAERAKFEAMVASGEVKVWEDDEDETRFDPQGRPFELPKRLWQRLEEDAATEDETSSATSSNSSPSPWLQPSPANPLVPPATWSATDRLHRCGHAVPLHTWTTIPIQGRGGASVDYSYDSVMRKAEAETRVKAKLLMQMHAPPRTLGAATRLQMVDTEAGWAGLVTPVGTKRMSVIGSRAFMKLGKAEAGTDDGSERAHWPLAMLSPKGESASNSTSLGGAGVPPNPPAPPQVPVPPINLQTIPIPPFGTPGGLASPGPTQGEPLPPDPPKPPTFGDKNLSAGAPQLPPIGPGQIAGTDCDDGEILPAFPGYSYALDIEPGGPDFTAMVDRVVEYLHDGWWALERVQRYLPEERLLAWNDERGASSAGNPSMEHHFGPYSKTLLRELQTILADAAERWVLGFPRPIKMPSQLTAGSSVTGSQAPTTSTVRTPIRFRGSTALGVCSSALGLRRTTATTMTYIDICPSWGTRSLESRLRTLIAISIDEKSASSALANWLIERARAQGKSAPYPVARCDDERSRTPYCAPPSNLRTLRSEEAWVDNLLRAGYWATYGAWRALADFVGDTPADMKSAWNEEMVVFDATGGPRLPDLAVYDAGDITEYETFGESSVGPSITYRAPRNLQRRFQSFSYRRYNVILRALAALGEIFVRESAPSPLDLASGESRLEVVLVEGDAGADDPYFAVAGTSELRVSRGAQAAPKRQVLASLIRALLTLTPDEAWEGAFTMGGNPGSGTPSSGRNELSLWVSSRYMWLGLCGVAVCPSGRMYRVPRPKILPVVVTKDVPAARGALLDLQVAIAVARMYGRSFFDGDLTTPGFQPTNAAHRRGLWGGATDASYHREQSLLVRLGRPYEERLLDELRRIWREVNESFKDTGVPTSSGGTTGIGTTTLGPYQVLQGTQPGGDGAEWSAQSPRQIRVPISFAFQSRRERMEILAQGFLEAAWHRLSSRTITTPSGATEPAISETNIHEMRRVATWLADYWEHLGRCVPEFSAMFDPVFQSWLYDRCYPFGGSGCVVGTVIGTNHSAAEIAHWRRDAELRIEQAAALVERSYRYLRLLSLLSDDERRVMWEYGEVALKVWIRDVLPGIKTIFPVIGAKPKIELPVDGGIPTYASVWRQAYPYAVGDVGRSNLAIELNARFRRCPSLRLWFGEYSDGLLRYLLDTFGILMRRFGVGFFMDEKTAPPLVFNVNLDPSLLTSWHYPPGVVFLREKRDSDIRRIRRTMHEATHWLWYGSMKPFRNSSLLNRGLPRDVRKKECADENGDSTCYHLEGATVLHRLNREQGAPYSFQNIDNFVAWSMSLYHNNDGRCDDLASGQFAAWPYPRSTYDAWVPPPNASLGSIARVPPPMIPGSVERECMYIPTLVESTGGLVDARDDFC